MGWLTAIKNLLKIISGLVEYFRNRMLKKAGKDEAIAEQAEYDKKRRNQANRIDESSRTRDPDDHFLRPPGSDK